MIKITSPLSNDLLHYASYIVIAKYKEKKDESPSGLYFNKIMSLSHRTLLDKGVNISLPHYWYRYGDQVHRYSMPNNLFWNHENPIKTTVEWKYEKPALSSDSTYGLIDKIITSLTEKYVDNEEQLIKEVYQYAPFEFQREILELREIIYGWKNAFNWDIESYKRISKKVILNTLPDFSDGAFQGLKKQYNTFKILVEIILEERNWDPRLFNDVCMIFWFWFCYHLRLNKKAYENIPKETIAYWESRLEFEDTRYRRNMGDTIIQASKKNLKITKNELLKKECSWRIEDLEETKKLIDEFEFTL